MTIMDHKVIRFFAMLTSACLGLVAFVGCASLDMGSSARTEMMPVHTHPVYRAPPQVVSPRVHVASTESDLPMGVSCGIIRANAGALDPNKPVSQQVRSGAAARGIKFTEAQIDAIANCLEKK